MKYYKSQRPVWKWLVSRLAFCLCASAVLVFGLAAVLCMMLIFITAAYNNQWICFLVATPVMWFGAYGFLELAMTVYNRF